MGIDQTESFRERPPKARRNDLGTVIGALINLVPKFPGQGRESSLSVVCHVLSAYGMTFSWYSILSDWQASYTPRDLYTEHYVFAGDQPYYSANIILAKPDQGPTLNESIVLLYCTKHTRSTWREKQENAEKQVLPEGNIPSSLIPLPIN